MEEGTSTPDWLTPGEEEPAPAAVVGDTSGFQLEASAADEDDDAPKSLGGGKCRRRCKVFSISGVSTLCIVAFVYSTIVQYNDPDRIKWSIYYGLQAVVPIFFLMKYYASGCPLEKLIYALTSGLVIWSIVEIVLISLDLKNLMKDNDPDPKMREEYIFELTGVSLGMLSAIYHGISVRCIERRAD